MSIRLSESLWTVYLDERRAETCQALCRLRLLHSVWHSDPPAAVCSSCSGQLQWVDHFPSGRMEDCMQPAKRPGESSWERESWGGHGNSKNWTYHPVPAPANVPLVTKPSDNGSRSPMWESN